jgi:hypothetical protein
METTLSFKLLCTLILLPLSAITLADGAPDFDDNSDDFSDVPFLHAGPGEVRLYRYLDQDQLLQPGYTCRTTTCQLFGVYCLRIEEIANDAAGQIYFYAAAARDTEGNCWLFEMYTAGQYNFKAESLEQITPFADYPEMYLRLMAGAYSSDLTLDYGQGTTAWIESISDDQVTAKTSDGSHIDWFLYDETVGLTRDIPDYNGDPNGSGWYLTEGNIDITIKNASFKRGRGPDNDSFTINGQFNPLPTQEQMEDDSDIFLRVGPYCALIKFNEFGCPCGPGYTGSPDGTSHLEFAVTAKTGAFTIRAGKADLTGLADPIPIQITKHTCCAVGVVPVEKARGLSATFLADSADSLTIDPKKLRLRQNARVSNRDSLSITGTITVQDASFDMAGQRVDISFGDYTDYIPAGDNGLKPQTGGNKFIFRKNRRDLTYTGSIASATFDLDKASFKININNADIPQLSGTIDFTLSCGDFYYRVPITLP